MAGASKLAVSGGSGGPTVRSLFRSTIRELLRNRKYSASALLLAGSCVFMLRKQAQYSKRSKAFTKRTTAVGARSQAAKQGAEKSNGGASKKSSNSSRSSSSTRGHVDGAFFRKLRRLLKIGFPTLVCKETGYLVALAVFLATRTFLSIKIAEVNGSIVRSIVTQKYSHFLARLAVLGSIAIPASTCNSMLKYLDNKLSLALRQRLQEYFHKKYMSPLTYYQVVNLDSRIHNPDQALTETVHKWADSLAGLYSNVTKPFLDIVLFSIKLSSLVGWEGPASVIAYYFVSGVLIRFISPQFGKLTARSQKLEGDFRHSHNRIITHGEEVAFYGGHTFELGVLRRKFAAIVHHSNELFMKHFWMDINDGFLVKYGSVMVGYAVLGMPVFGKNSEEYLQRVADDPARITQDYIRNSSLLINLARAIGRIVTSYKELQKLAGYTALVADLQDVISDLGKGQYRRHFVNAQLLDNKGYAPGNGKVINSDDSLVFDSVPIVTPNGDLLVDNINLTITRGMNLMIVGPNGCGKSSLFRILGGLWPLFGGQLSKPCGEDGLSHSGNIFYIPQKPYLCIGTLRDQVIYPHSEQDMKRKGFSDADLDGLLQLVQLQYIVGREGGWDAIQSWADVLSGGEKQRIAMARLFYHRPKFAILDECTSAVSMDVEGTMYSHARKVGIALITVSHRPSLWKYHQHCLKFDGRGGWSFGKMVLPKDYQDGHA